VAMVGLGVAALLVGVVYSQASAATTAHYRTAPVGTHDVTATLTSVGSIEPVSGASVAFPAAGTVATVNVAPGDTVVAGQTLATLDTTSLVINLHDQQATLATAQLTLAKALAGESVTTSTGRSGSGGSSSAGGSGSASSSGSSSGSSAGTGSASSQGSGQTGGQSGRGSATTAPTTEPAPAPAPEPPATEPTPAPTPAPSPPDTELSNDQQAVLAAQHQVDIDLATANAAIAASTTACTFAATPTTTEITACQSALQAVHDAQAAVAVDQTALAAASTALDTLLTQRAGAPAPTATPTAAATTATPTPVAAVFTTTASAAVPAATVAATASPSASSAAAASPSAADLISYQKAVDAAAANVTVAEQAIAQATIVSPIAGTVEAVNLAAGQTVTAASTSQTIVVAAPGGIEVTTTVGVDDMPNVKVGQPATVVADSTGETLTGTVVSISAVPVTASSTSTSATSDYRLIIGFASPPVNLGIGSTGSVSIVTGTVTAVMAVPTSAVATAGTRHTVVVPDGDATKDVAVEVGVIGDQWTQITSGLALGQSVVLANIDQPLPGSATTAATTANRQGVANRGQGGFIGGANGAGAGAGAGGARPNR
jgi:multidrug efflux pump subunit AcrA (membrane-fusion protein)